MSDDLISRQTLLQVIYEDKNFLKRTLGKYEKNAYMSPELILDRIKSVPTAYDVDRVVRKITELQLKIKDKSLAVEDEEYAVMLRGQLRGIADCLEIVKSGGVTDE